MVRIVIFFSVLAIIITPTSALSKDSSHGEHHQGKSSKSHWEYTGAHGTDHWGELSKDYHMCSSGHEQSPIDLKWRRPSSKRSLKLNYKAKQSTVVNNGHTIQVNYQKGNTITADGQNYSLKQMHFHSPSEHTIAGKHFPMEVHLVHADNHGKLLVVGVMIQEGTANDSIDNIWKSTSSEIGKVASLKTSVNPTDFLPKIKTHYNYSGSLTTPPCSEGVNWNVFNTPISFSKKQIQIFKQQYAGTNRPIQRLFNRHPANY